MKGPGVEIGVLDLSTGIFTCITPGYYTVSFSLYGHEGPDYDRQDIFLFKNGIQLSESRFCSWMASGAVANDL